MATPIKATYSGSTPTGFAELQASDNFEVPILSKFSKAIQETKTEIAASNIDVSLGTLFTKTISTGVTWTLSNIPSSGTLCTIILELTNAGSQTITWTGFTGLKWAGGTAPTLTTSGKDILGFYTHDGGASWNGMVMAKDVK